MDYSVIILCAGSGKRTGLKYNKMFHLIDGITIYQKSLDNFIEDNDCKEIIVVCKKEEQDDFKNIITNTKIKYVEGGNERQDSVYNGLKEVIYDYVMIHDGARPYLKRTLIDDLKTCLSNHQACLLMVPVKDTIKEVTSNKVAKTLNRAVLYQAQTPQAFKTSLIKMCHQKAKEDNYIGTDDTSLVEKYSNESVYVIEGDYQNIKVTTKEDL